MSHVISYGKSNTGRHRLNNEDAFILKPELGFVAVADGMGGSASGEVASQTFVDTASDIFKKSTEHSGKEISKLVQNTFRSANAKILKKARENPRHQGMGCTADLMSFDSRGYVLGHVGDSRTYLYRNGRLRQITKDHSVVQEQIDRGIITPEEARNSSFRHTILRAVGVKETLAVDMIRGSHTPGDIFLLCSDGLTDMVDDPSILKILLRPIDAAEKIDRLIEAANANGGKDNITVILCEVKDS
jgi:serine/threonine protein phosphatase PrpC